MSTRPSKPTATAAKGTKAKGTATPLPTVASDEFSKRSKPVPLGQAYPLQLEHKQFFSIGISDVVRGDEAWKRIKKANQFNDAPPEGKEYLIAFVTVYYSEGPTDKPLEINQFDFKVVSNGQILSDFVSVSGLDPKKLFEKG